MLENTPKTEILGTDVYTFGLYCMIGAVCAVIAILFLCRNEKMKKGTGILLSCLCLLCGALFSRILFCLLHDVSMGGVPIDDWFRFSGGGFSLFGMVFGVFAGAFVCSLISGENRNKLLDISSCAIPLFIAAERFGEHLFEGFDVSRQLKNGSFPDGSFLAVQDAYYEDVSFLATYLLSAICSMILFFLLVFFLTREQRSDGDLWILFMILCGAGGIMLESLRYDHFLEYSFVCFQQIMAALLLVWGVVLAGLRKRKNDKGKQIASIISLPFSIAVCGGIEFALDRLGISHYILYLIMLLSLTVPVSIGILLIRNRQKRAGAF